MSEVTVSSVTFSEHGVEFTFMELPGDVRQEGRLVQTRSLAATWDNPNYRDELEELRSAVTTAVLDILEDWPAAPVYEPAADEDHLVDEFGSPGLGQGRP